MVKQHNYENGCFTDEIGNIFDKNGNILEEIGTDKDFDRYSIEVQNGEGYYSTDGKFVRYRNDD